MNQIKKLYQDNELYLELDSDKIIVLGNDIVHNFIINLNPNDKSYILSYNENKIVETDIMINLINYKKFQNMEPLLELLLFLIKNPKAYCIGCADILDCKSDVYATCGKLSCSCKMEEYILFDDVTTFIKNNYDSFTLLIHLTKESINSSKVFDFLDPFPNYFLDSSYKNNLMLSQKRGNLMKLELSPENFEAYNKAKQINKIKEIINQLDLNEIKNNPGLINDQTFAKSIGMDCYFLLRFIIKSCLVNIIKETETETITVYKIIHPFYIENEFKKKSNDKHNSYLFHGSPSECWYSILRNGIKIMSATNMQLNGAAYGSGIYTSNDYNFSLSYANRGINSVKKPIVGVFEVIGSKDTYVTRNKSIYVIPSNDLCLLKYLIVGKASDVKNTQNKESKKINKLYEKEDAPKSEIDFINQYFESILQEKKLNETIKMKSINNKKLMNEYKRMTTNEKFNYHIKLIDDNLLNWEVTYLGVTVCFKFPELFPFEPPFVYIVKPKFNISAQNITSDGAICSEYLTKSNWLPAISIECLIVQIFSLIIEPNIIYMINQSNDSYDEQLAIKSYEKLAKGNSWL